MDIEEWEVLPDDGFLEIHDDDDDDGGSNNFFSRKYGSSADFKHVFQLNDYFDPPPTPPEEHHHHHHLRHRHHHPRELAVVPVPIQLHHHQSAAAVKATELPLELDLVTDKKITKSPRGFESNEDTFSSQVFFKKENEFVDMKMDSPRSDINSNNTSRGIVPPVDAAAGTFHFDEGNETIAEGDKDDLVNKNNNNNFMDAAVNGGGGGGERERERGNGSCLNMWRWSLSGVGAICSFGVAAAATICIIVFTNHHHHNNNSQKLPFRIYTHDKRIKQVVQHASELDEAISVARGVPLTRAHFTVGGYYDGL